MLERNYRLSDLSTITGYTVAAIRKKIRRRELGYRKIGRIVVVPESEVKQREGARLVERPCHRQVPITERSRLGLVCPPR